MREQEKKLNNSNKRRNKWRKRTSRRLRWKWSFDV